MERLEFPKGFLWGAATSAHQVEGDNHNDWSEWEKSPARLAQLKREGKDPADFISGKACDSYNRYAEDFDIAKELGHNVHRFSIEWSRIEPEEGKFDEEAIEHYKRLIDALRERGIEPMVTLWHFTNPVWFAQKGGFLSPKSPEYFTRYVKHVVDKMKDRVGLWITFNEATSVYAGMSYALGVWPPQMRSLRRYLKIQNNFIKAHILAYREIKKIYSDVSQSGPPLPDTSHNIAMVGAVENFSHVIAGPWLKALAWIIDHFRNMRFWHKVAPYQDFLGLNYYTIRRLPDSRKARSVQEFAEEMSWEIYPEGIYQALLRLKKFKKPVYITENGIADRTDLKRAKFIRDHLYWVHKAINSGVDVRGYMYWSLLDNFEWAHGFGPRFGLTEIDYKTFKRTIRPSAYEYAKICKDNALEI
ncbi:MAG TPA: glycoside hydrolase family 1 protein [Candidatus Paceibacterota bacterium]|nr:glycoside hydrolase family 1 protein [Candidatus Paceibacterota bacterium]